MALRIRAFTRATTFQERKQEYIQWGYRIDDKCPTPVNGLCSFVAWTTPFLILSSTWSFLDRVRSKATDRKLRVLAPNIRTRITCEIQRKETRK